MPEAAYVVRMPVDIVFGGLQACVLKTDTVSRRRDCPPHAKAPKSGFGSGVVISVFC